MLHISDTDGNEKFAYIPSTVLPKLRNFAEKNDEYIYLNDGSPVAGEVCVNDQQTSVIVGTTGRAEEVAAVYAVDASRMGSSDYSPSASDVMWEFTAADDADLGLPVHKPELGTVKKDGKDIPVAVVSGTGKSNRAKPA
ncbi:hypothetical protein BG910_11710 [Neisseria chenwenguii]|uniref:Uncharacterized protein n=1 Tax=Neisseria chenwenguii TaxID=1853278 RepID=A0A220S473_9NEIS|nr:PilC/PilY family type IV pilus protein [Neisseria chenwenguii]ASK28311.1 hypothetical protein BG910_11710 [Neisseria chenwenguii]